MYRSPGAARRSGEERYGSAVNVYECPHCDTHHITSQGVARSDDADPLLDRLVAALLGAGAADIC